LIIINNDTFDLSNEKESKKVYYVEAGSKITKIWKIRNNGISAWTPQLTLRRIVGNIESIEEQHILAVPLLKPGEEDAIAITFKIPSDIKEETDFFSVWRFCYKDKIFGKPLNLNVTVRPSDGFKLPKYNLECEDLHFSESDDSSISDSVVYPPCFNLNVPFLKANDSTNSQSSQSKILSPRKFKIDPVKIDKKIDYNCPKSESNLDSASDSNETSIALRQKLHLRKLKETKSSINKKECKKSFLKSTKSSTDLLIPTVSDSIVEKIKNKNETVQTNCDHVPIPIGVRNMDSNNASIKSGPSRGNSKIHNSRQLKTSSFLTNTSTNKGHSSKPKCTLDQFGDILPNVSRTFSQFCNLIVNPGPSHVCIINE